MEFKQLDRKVYAAGQITHADINLIGARGFKAIICNRPDGEADHQPDFDALEAHAEQVGLPMTYIPYANGTMTPKLLHRLEHTIDAVDGPVLLYCRTGRRSEMLWNAIRGPMAFAAE